MKRQRVTMLGVNNFIHIGVLLTTLLFITETTDARSIKDHNIVKRQIYCQQRFYVNYGTSHSACLPPSRYMTKSGVSEDDKKEIVDEHNRHRREVIPTAANMLKMSWDDEIAKIAQGMANRCPSSHDASGQRQDYGRYEYLGQNLAWGYRNWSHAINGWDSEKTDFNYTTNDATVAGKQFLHYTQVVWAESFKIGCGYAECGSSRTYVCNYGPGGNYRSRKPYISGDSCANCSNTCSDKLCDCGGMDCYSDGKRSFNITDCTCNCLYGLKAPDCTVDCENLAEVWFCKTDWQGKCKWQNKYYCAFTCGLCKAAESTTLA